MRRGLAAGIKHHLSTLISCRDCADVCATAAGIVVPKNYLTQVCDDGFRKQPVGAGPYRMVGHKPGLEVELEAFPGYWRRVPSVKTIVMTHLAPSPNPDDDYRRFADEAKKHFSGEIKIAKDLMQF